MALRGCMANVVTLLGAKWRREKTRCPLRGVGTALRPFFLGGGRRGGPIPPFFARKRPLSPLRSSSLTFARKNTPPTVCQGPRRKNPYGFPLWNAQKKKEKECTAQKRRRVVTHPPFPNYPLLWVASVASSFLGKTSFKDSTQFSFSSLRRSSFFFLRGVGSAEKALSSLSKSHCFAAPSSPPFLPKWALFVSF